MARLNPVRRYGVIIDGTKAALSSYGVFVGSILAKENENTFMASQFHYLI